MSELIDDGMMGDEEWCDDCRAAYCRCGFDERNYEDEWECAFGKDCVNPHYFHQRSDCYTADMAQSCQDDN